MKKERRSKILTIVALALTLVALTLGFAAFSTSLSISSNATVSPNESDFKITIYGMKDEASANQFQETGTFTNEHLSSTTSVPPTPASEAMSSTTALIDNSTHTISNISVTLVEPATEQPYYFIIKNEGEYDAYLDLSDYEIEESSYILINEGTCIAGPETTEELMNAACPYVVNIIVVEDSSNTPARTGEKIIEIPKGDYIRLGFGIGYMETENRVDGPFTVSFQDIKLDFSTAK